MADNIARAEAILQANRRLFADEWPAFVDIGDALEAARADYVRLQAAYIALKSTVIG